MGAIELGGHSAVRESSFYVAVRDGTRLAVRLFSPGQSERPLPIIWCHHRYNRPRTNSRFAHKWALRYPAMADAIMERIGQERQERPHILSALDWLPAVIESGFHAAIVDIRGTGASFGRWTGPFSSQEQLDAYDVIEWFAAQPWCDGNVAMFGRSYMGANQYLAAAARPPHLRAIFPEMAPFDVYSLIHDNGVFREDFAQSWSADVRDRDVFDSAFAVQADEQNQLLKIARGEHAENEDVFSLFRDARVRDATHFRYGNVWDEFSVSSRWRNLSNISVPVYHLVGWHDVRPIDAFLYMMNCDAPFRLVVGPWAHQGRAGIDMAREHIEWYSACFERPSALKGHRSVTYCVTDNEGVSDWRVSSLADFLSLPSLQLHLAGDGQEATLHHEQRQFAPHKLKYWVNDATTSGFASRWSNGYGGPFGYTDMSENDRRSITFTTPVLTRAVEVCGFPTLTINLNSTTAPHIFVFLEDVHPDGFSQYVTEGVLSLQHRRRAIPPYAMPEVPFHSGLSADLAPLPCANERVEIALLPIATRFRAGHRIRIAICGADSDNAERPPGLTGSALVLNLAKDLTNVLTLPHVATNGDLF